VRACACVCGLRTPSRAFWAVLKETGGQRKQVYEEHEDCLTLNVINHHNIVQSESSFYGSETNQRKLQKKFRSSLAFVQRTSEVVLIGSVKENEILSKH